MTPPPPDFTWLYGEYGEYGYSFLYVRDTPERAVARLGGRWPDFTPGPFPEDADQLCSPGEPAGVAAIGDWTFVIESDLRYLYEDLLARLSEDTTLVTQAALSIEGADNFAWYEDGAVRFECGSDDGFFREPPDELTAVLAEADRLFPEAQLYEGPAFMLVEHLTGIRLTEELVRGLDFAWGHLPPPR
ncbi:DUF6461 domain-containing protein [Nonomuraea sp. NPDC050328]|uniref:DUF6461 domain-containing protein n=1 Tax=Nonomuraea sp. NPDC050328 TaxID=3364361 RepID=UPI00378771F7